MLKPGTRHQGRDDRSCLRRLGKRVTVTVGEAA